MIYYKETGKGLPVVLLHGYGEDLSLWDNLSPALSSGFRVIALDLPGFGQSDRLPGSFSIDDVAHHVVPFLSEELKLNKFVVLGHSLGGYVALAMAEHYPERIEGFGLINSTALEDSPEKKQNRIKTADFIRKHKAQFFLENFVPNLFYEENRRQLIDEIEFVVSMGRNLDEVLLADYMIAMKDRPDRRHLLSKYERVLLIGGEKDGGITKNDLKTQISALRNRSNAHILENVGHMSMYEAPEKLQTISLNFLNSI